MSIASTVAKKLIKVRERMHSLSSELEKLAREVDSGVDAILDSDNTTHNDDDVVIIGDFKLVLTCIACPEQYDAYYDNEDVPCAYFRLRHGEFTVRVPDAEGTLVYDTTRIEGDGVFASAEERLFQLTAGVDAVKDYLLQLYRKTVKEALERK